MATATRFEELGADNFIKVMADTRCRIKTCYEAWRETQSNTSYGNTENKSRQTFKASWGVALAPSKYGWGELA